MKTSDHQETRVQKNCIWYASIAEVILDRPEPTWRNKNIEEARRAGASEEEIAAWAEAYDRQPPGEEDETPLIDRSYTVGTRNDHLTRQIHANFTIDPVGRGLADPVRVADRAAGLTLNVVDALQRHARRAREGRAGS